VCRTRLNVFEFLIPVVYNYKNPLVNILHVQIGFKQYIV
jgi:hypothetical protein